MPEAATKKRPARKSTPPADAQPDAPPNAPASEVETVEVTPEEKALLINARALREAAQKQSEPGEAQIVPAEQQQQVIMVEDERAQRELDLRVVNQQIIEVRQALAAAKLNRLMNSKGYLEKAAKEHEMTFRKEIHEMRQVLDYLIAVKFEMGPHGIEEPTVSAIEVADASEVQGLRDLARA